jgi:hypothetical protein
VAVGVTVGALGALVAVAVGLVGGFDVGCSVAPLVGVARGSAVSTGAGSAVAVAVAAVGVALGAAVGADEVTLRVVDAVLPAVTVGAERSGGAPGTSAGRPDENSSSPTEKMMATVAAGMTAQGQMAGRR